jgi:protein-disulfide isomerase
MKRSYLILSLLSFAGLVITFVLLLDYYFPKSVVETLSCGGAGTDCSQLLLSPYKNLFGVPIAAFTLFLYLWLFLSIHLFKESGEIYWNTLVYIMLPVIVIFLGINIIMSIFMIAEGVLCKFCAGLFLVNAGFTAVTYLEYRRIFSITGVTLTRGITSLPKYIRKNEDRIFSSGTALYYTVLLFLCVISFSLFTSEKSKDKRDDVNKAESYLNDYKVKKQNEYSLPSTPFITGDRNAPLTITVFTDPLCSACRTFHEMEKMILAKYGETVKMEYYFFPALECEKEVPSPSCRSVMLMFAAEKAGIYDSVVVNHFDRYDVMRNLYIQNAPTDEIAAQLTPDESKAVEMVELYSTDDVFNKMRGQIDLAKKLNLSATPTLIINGRMLRGFPRFEYMSKIIEFELENVK